MTEIPPLQQGGKSEFDVLGSKLQNETSKSNETRPGYPRFYEIIQEWVLLHSDKNHDYAGIDDPLRNLKACERITVRCPHCSGTFPFKAWWGVVVRLEDKLSRLESLIGSDPKVKESIGETFDDNGIYSALGRILYEEEK